jgi:hypothetical protein
MRLCSGVEFRASREEGEGGPECERQVKPLSSWYEGLGVACNELFHVSAFAIKQPTER